MLKFLATELVNAEARIKDLDQTCGGWSAD